MFGIACTVFPLQNWMDMNQKTKLSNDWCGHKCDWKSISIQCIRTDPQPFKPDSNLFGFFVQITRKQLNVHSYIFMLLLFLFLWDHRRFRDVARGWCSHVCNHYIGADWKPTYLLDLLIRYLHHFLHWSDLRSWMN